MAEWLRRWTANPLGYARVGSNPILVDCFVSSFCDLLNAKGDERDHKREVRLL